MNIRVFYTRKEYAVLEKKLAHALKLLNLLINVTENASTREAYRKLAKEIDDIR